MDMGNNIFKMEIHMMEITQIINLMVKEHTVGRVEQYIRDNSNMVKEMDMVFGDQMERIGMFTKVIIQTIKNMERVYIDGQMELFMMVGLKKI